MMKRLLAAALLLPMLALGQANRAPLIVGATATGAGTAVSVYNRGAYRAFQAYGLTKSGAGAATLLVQVSTVSTGPWMTACTIPLTLSTSLTLSTTDGCTMSAAWPYVRGNVSALSGTGAAVSLDMGLLQ